MSIDWTISLGTVVGVVSLLFSAAGVVWALRGDMRVLGSRLASVEAHMSRLSDVLVQIGRQDERLNSHEKRIERLEETA